MVAAVQGLAAVGSSFWLETQTTACTEPLPQRAPGSRALHWGRRGVAGMVHFGTLVRGIQHLSTR